MFPDTMGNAVKFRQTKLPMQAGETARLKVVKGPDEGAVFVVKAAKASLGRGDENDVVLADLRSSRRHAELVRDIAGVWSVRDLGSANGILHGGQAQRQVTLKAGDQFAIGETIVEFVPAEAGSKMIEREGKAPAKALAQLADANVTRQLSVPADPTRAVAAPTRTDLSARLPAPAGLAASAPAPSPFAGLTGASPTSRGSDADARKRILMIVAAGVAAWLYFDDGPATGAKTGAPRDGTAKTETASRDLASYLPPSTGADSAEMFFRAGFREYREKNFLRAKTNFETALQINPNHRLARLYLSHSDTAIQREIENNLKLGKKEYLSGKLKAARGHYESVLRALYRDQANPSFGEAKEQLEKVETKLKGGSSG